MKYLKSLITILFKPSEVLNKIEKLEKSVTEINKVVNVKK